MFDIFDLTDTKALMISLLEITCIFLLFCAWAIYVSGLARPRRRLVQLMTLAFGLLAALISLYGVWDIVVHDHLFSLASWMLIGGGLINIGILIGFYSRILIFYKESEMRSVIANDL